MKRNIVTMLVMFVLLSCGSKSGDTQPNATAPTINNAVIVQKNSLNQYEAKYAFHTGEYYNMGITATDPDLDIESVELTYYNYNTGDLVAGPNLYQTPSQSAESMVFYFTTDIQISSNIPLGNYRISVQAIDKKGLESNLFYVNATIQ